MFLRVSALVLTVSLLPLSATWAEDEHAAWHTDFDAAVTLAADTGKYLLVDFSGSDWCGWCKKLDKEVFVHDEFLNEVQKKYILVVLDFPRNKEVKNAKRNAEIRDLFKVTGYPTVLLMDEAAKPFARTGYFEGGPEAYLKHMAHLEDWHGNIAGEVKKVQDAEAGAKADAISGLIDYLQGLGKQKLDYGHHFSIAFPEVTALLDEAIRLDSQDEKGLKTKAAQYLLDLEQITDTLRKALNELDPKNEKGLLERVFMAELNEKMVAEDGAAVIAMVKGFVKDKKFREKDTEAMVRYWAGYAAFAWLEDKKQAMEFLDQAKALEPANPRLRSSIDKLVQEVNKE